MNERNPISFKVEPALHERLESAAQQTNIKKTTLMIMALEALLEAIERNDFKLVVPVKFDVTHIPVPRVRSGMADETSLVEDSALPDVNYSKLPRTGQPALMHDAPSSPPAPRPAAAKKPKLPPPSPPAAGSKQ